jgi:hypothetical protein
VVPRVPAFAFAEEELERFDFIDGRLQDGFVQARRKAGADLCGSASVGIGCPSDDGPDDFGRSFT